VMSEDTAPLMQNESLFGQARGLQVVDDARDGCIAKAGDGFVNHVKRNEELCEIELGRREDAVKEVFPLRAIDFRQLIVGEEPYPIRSRRDVTGEIEQGTEEYAINPPAP
jgi:hypothetical protein